MNSVFRRRQHTILHEHHGSREIVALFIHSMSIIGVQIILMRILSINQWDHFANMIIGIAMLGFGVSGSLLVITKTKLLKHSQTLVPLLMILTPVFMLAAYRLSQADYLKFDTYLVFSSVQHLFRLIVFIMLYFLPFLSASLAIGIIYVKNVSGIGKLYFSNLVGSGLGGVAGLILLNFFLPHNALTVSAMLPALAALFLWTRSNRTILSAGYILLFLVITISLVKPVHPAMSQYKSLSRILQLPDAEIVVTENGISSLVHIVRSDYLRYAPGLSLHFTGEVPVKPMAFINGNAAGYIPSYGTEDQDILSYTTFSLPYIISQPDNVVVISAGTGELVAQAMRNGAQHIDAFEADINLVSALDRLHHMGYHSVYQHDAVTLHKSEARSFLKGINNRYNLIVLPTIGSFGGTSGLQALKENYDMTLESLKIYWQLLEDDGMMALTVYTDFPPRTMLKTVYALVVMLRQQGIDKPEDHIAAVRSWTAISFAVSKQKLSEQSIRKVRKIADEMGFDPFLLPGIQDEERVFYNYIDDKLLFHLTDAILEGNLQEPDNYMFYIKPASDNKPFFSRYLKISGLRSLMNKYTINELPFLELGYFMVWLTFIVAVIFSALFILLPVTRFRKSKAKSSVLVYFGAIGLGFMFTEIILIQKFILYLGQPVFAVSVVLSIMLIASGLGSYVSGRFLPGRKIHLMTLVVISIVLFIYALFLTDVLNGTAGAPVWGKICIACVVVGLPAFFMGLPFPLGLKALSGQHDDKIAWAWGINGFFSVIATPLALIIAVEAGSFLVICLAAMAYLLALSAMYALVLKGRYLKTPV
jgi:hypothetical protein